MPAFANIISAVSPKPTSSKAPTQPVSNDRAADKAGQGEPQNFAKTLDSRLKQQDQKSADTASDTQTRPTPDKNRATEDSQTTANPAELAAIAAAMLAGIDKTAASDKAPDIALGDAQQGNAEGDSTALLGIDSTLEKGLQKTADTQAVLDPLRAAAAVAATATASTAKEPAIATSAKTGPQEPTLALAGAATGETKDSAATLLGAKAVETKEPVAALASDKTPATKEPVAPLAGAKTADAKEPIAALAGAKTTETKEPVAALAGAKLVEGKEGESSVPAANGNNPQAPAPTAQSFVDQLAAKLGSPQKTEAPQFTVPTPVGHPTWPQDVGNRIVWMAGKDLGKAELVLTPPHLGRMEISLSLNGDQASASFVTASPAAREALEQALPKLREMMSQAGIDLSQANVSTNNAGQQTAQEQGWSSRRNANTQSGDAADASEIAAVSSPQILNGNGLVDTFA